MDKSKKTERALFDALDRLVAGNSQKTDGKTTQENIAKEAGVSRATFNRYTNVVQEYQRIKAHGSGHEEVKPFTLEDKNRELQESNTQLRRKVANDKAAYDEHLAAARQEIMILNLALTAREETIAVKDRELAKLRQTIARMAQGKTSHMTIVE